MIIKPTRPRGPSSAGASQSGGGLGGHLKQEVANWRPVGQKRPAKSFHMARHLIPTYSLHLHLTRLDPLELGNLFYKGDVELIYSEKVISELTLNAA